MEKTESIPIRTVQNITRVLYLYTSKPLWQRKKDPRKSRGMKELETENTQRNLDREKSQDRNRKKFPKNMLTERNKG